MGALVHVITTNIQISLPNVETSGHTSNLACTETGLKRSRRRRRDSIASDADKRGEVDVER